MTDLQYDFLKRYRASGYPYPSDLSYADRGFFLTCLSDHYIMQIIDSSVNIGYRISDLGQSGMLEYEHHLHQQAEEHAQREAERKADRAHADERCKKQFRHD